MQSILKNIKTFIAITVTAGSTGLGGFLYGQYITDQAVVRLTDLLVQESETVSPFEYEAVKLAEALDGEARAHQDDWPHIVAGVFNRTDDARWADTPLGVLLDGDIDALFDEHPEDLTTEVGQAALSFATTSLVAYQDGTIKLSHEGHSWATPTAADGHTYFDGLCQVAEASGHQYFGDCTVAPSTSLRPVAREDGAIMAAITIAMEE